MGQPQPTRPTTWTRLSLLGPPHEAGDGVTWAWGLPPPPYVCLGHMGMQLLSHGCMAHGAYPSSCAPVAVVLLLGGDLGNLNLVLWPAGCSNKSKIISDVGVSPVSGMSGTFGLIWGGPHTNLYNVVNN